VFSEHRTELLLVKEAANGCLLTRDPACMHHGGVCLLAASALLTKLHGVTSQLWAIVITRRYKNLKHCR
jgi:hypothetical protein